MGKYYRAQLAVGSHTEYTRILSEHGAFGLLAICVLLRACLKNLRRARTPLERAMVGSFLAWSLLFMASAAMRLAAPAFMFGLSFVTLLPDQNVRRRFSRNRRRRLRRRRRTTPRRLSARQASVGETGLCVE